MFLLDPRSAWGRSATTWQLHSWLSLLGSSSPSPSGCKTVVSASQPLPSHPVTKSPQTGPCQHGGGAAPPGGEEHNHHGHPPGLAHQLLSTQPGAGEDNTPLKVSNWLVVSFLLHVMTEQKKTWKRQYLKLVHNSLSYCPANRLHFITKYISTKWQKNYNANLLKTSFATSEVVIFQFDVKMINPTPRQQFATCWKLFSNSTKNLPDRKF